MTDLDFNTLVIPDEQAEVALTEEERKAIIARKHGWEGLILASDLTWATKGFAIIIIRYAYGAKTVCWPSGEDIMSSGNWNRDSKFPAARRALINAGALQGDLAHHTGRTNRYPNYKYTINLAWDGGTPTKPTQAEQQAPAPSTTPPEAPAINAQAESAPKPQGESTEPQSAVAIALSGW